MRIYMDVCCLNRPYDDLSQDRVYIEAEAVLTIISRCEKTDWVLLSSSIIDYELSNLPDAYRLEQVRSIYNVSKERIALNTLAENRAAAFQQQGLKPFDSMHVAVAEAAKADIFLTTDDRLLKAASRIPDLELKISNPVSWLMEVTSNERSR